MPTSALPPTSATCWDTSHAEDSKSASTSRSRTGCAPVPIGLRVCARRKRKRAFPAALHKLQAEDGDDLYFLESTGEFVVVSPAGYIRTYYLTDRDYFERQ